MVKYYRKADKLQKERDNEKMWLQGMYIYDALCDVSPIFKDFAKKGTKPIEYPNRPYAITKEEIKQRQAEREKAKYEKIKAKTSAYAIKLNAVMAQRKEGENSG